MVAAGAVFKVNHLFKINLQRDREKVTARKNEGDTKIGLFLSHYPVIKVGWLAAGVLLISSTVRLVNGQICRTCRCRIYTVTQSLGIKKPALPTNKKERIQAEWVSNLPQRNKITNSRNWSI